MFTRKVLVSVLFAAGMIGAAATPLPSLAAIDVFVNFAPPPPRYERVPELRRGYIWSPGYWDWRGNRHVWVNGVAVRERQGFSYQPRQWVEHDGRWNLQRSQWNQARGRDSDRDGIPDRRDPTPFGGAQPRDRDGDGVPNNRDARPNDPTRR
jgi:hypothetical protein